ncbi:MULTISPECIES: nickel/cobalt transporter [Chelatococcus]|uniref:Nickel/cobalt efflux system n=1 Tax=Chelatococcus daeguensis TaxID=444444 RepID=A0AAC9JR84_9HYPH|nr:MULTISPECIES: nickel/cobalt transporter [Chelatococcus]APF38338.1 nickel transporter [Chelatococcus daeguensis]
MTSVGLAGATAGPRLVARRLVVAIIAVAVVTGVLALIAHLLQGSATPAPPARNPFGTGLREAAPEPTGFGAFILAVQSQYYRQLTAAVQAMKQDGAAFWSLVAIGFAYGVFHAAGPGHGKGVISGYIVASGRSLKRGVGLSFAAALVQALVAIALIAVLALALNATARSINETARLVELASFAAVALMGAAVLWRKAGRFVAIGLPQAGAASCDDDCGHVHIPPPEALDRMRDWREMAGIALAAGIRPCSGALIVLVFALSQGLFAAGVAATLAMALGTALTTGALAALAVFAKALALRLAGGRGLTGARIVGGLEVLAGAFVLVLGLALLAGLWAGAAPS